MKFVLRFVVCRGSSYGLVISDHLYEQYRTRYTNCTYVDGNLELVFIQNNYDLSFLKDIREVTGYVLIVSVMSEFLSLTNLRIIRGQTLYNYNGMDYSLFVASSQGLKELQFVSLHGRLFLFLASCHTLSISDKVYCKDSICLYFDEDRFLFSGLLCDCLLWNKNYACMYLFRHFNGAF